MDVEGERRRDKCLNLSKSGIFLLVKGLFNNPGKCNFSSVDSVSLNKS